MSFFKPIPDESRSDRAGFTTRRIRKAGDTDLLATTQKLLDRFADEDDDMLVSEMGDLVDALHRSALLVQRTKQRVLLCKLHRCSRKKSSTRK
ncbi:MAG: hypothetical protein ABIH35_01430 [Patescibacteria group bacterium]